MKRFLDVIAWILVGMVAVIVAGALGFGLWELFKWFFGAGAWKFALEVTVIIMVVRTLRWAFCRVTGDPVPYWSNMGMFE